MKIESILGSLSNFFLVPEFPRRALAFEARRIAAVSVQRKGSRLVLQRHAMEPIPEGLIVPSFEGPNVKDPQRLAASVHQVLERAGLKREKKWSVSLPRHASRMMILQVDEVPSKRAELAEVLEFKVERMLEVASDDLTVSFQRLTDDALGARFLTAAVRNEVQAAYEEPLRAAGLHPGLVVPGQLAEAAWLFMNPAPGDRVLMATEGDELLVIFARSGELISLRTAELHPDSLTDEIHRSLVYYLDKLASSDAKLALVLLSGEGLHPGQVREICELLFEPGSVPSVQSLADQAIEGSQDLQLHRVSSAVALAALGAR
ncbi:MAG: hypothetical protein HY650_05340 [Acidobacteria bacterium]|nr:hypothetical protein [Acidobacteriota bacterium]